MEPDPSPLDRAADAPPGSRLSAGGDSGASGTEDDGPAGPVPRGLAHPHLATAVVFFCSAAVLIIEILAGRLLAPYVGVSLETYTGIIGTVLAGIAVGSAAGGRLADRHDPRRLVGPTIVLGGAAALFALPSVSFFGPELGRGGGPIAIVSLAVLAFVVPTALLSAVSPMMAKVRLVTTAETGTVVGGLSAAATAGALVGTFATGFILVAALPSRLIVVVLGVVLIALGAALWIGLRRDVPVAALLAALAVTGVAVASPAPCDTETAYYCVSVVVDPQRPTGRTLMMDNVRHSYVDLADPSYLQFRYVRLFAQLTDASRRSGPVDALFLGGGGFTFPRWVLHQRPGSRVVVLELDPGVVAVAEEQLGLQTEALRIRTGDGRRNTSDEATGSYDLVIGDAFGGLSVPWHLATTEMAGEIARTLRPDGVYIANIIDGGPRDLVKAEVATFAEHFTEVALVTPPGAETYGNYVLIASNRSIPLDRVDPADGSTMTGTDLEQFVGDARPLTDDFAPVDQLITRRP